MNKAMEPYLGAEKKFVVFYKDTDKKPCTIHAARYVVEGDTAKFFGNGPRHFATLDMTVVDRIEEP